MTMMTSKTAAAKTPAPKAPAKAAAPAAKDKAHGKAEPKDDGEAEQGEPAAQVQGVDPGPPNETAQAEAETRIAEEAARARIADIVSEEYENTDRQVKCTLTMRDGKTRTATVKREDELTLFDTQRAALAEALGS